LEYNKKRSQLKSNSFKEVNATKPFMLSSAEAYDPLWKAKDGKLVEIIRSVPLYSVINGFWIK